MKTRGTILLKNSQKIIVVTAGDVYTLYWYMWCTYILSIILIVKAQQGTGNAKPGAMCASDEMLTIVDVIVDDILAK